MLADKERFDIVEQRLRKNGDLDKYEEKYGPILGRMMIVEAEPPKDIKIRTVNGTKPVCFEATFDFYDTAVGLLIYPDTLNPASGAWLRQQTDQKEEIDEAWIEFFIQKLIENFQVDEGWYADTVYSFVNDSSDLTVFPVRPEGE